MILDKSQIIERVIFCLAIEAIAEVKDLEIGQVLEGIFEDFNLIFDEVNPEKLADFERDCGLNLFINPLDYTDEDIISILENFRTIGEF